MRSKLDIFEIELDMTILEIFTNILLPVLLLAGAGYTIGKLLNIESRPLGRVIFYIFSPVLVFDLITQSHLPLGKIFLMVGFSASQMLISAILALLLCLLFRIPRMSRSIVILTVLIGNAGNFGLPVVAFAFGDEALAYASIYFVTSNILLYTLGVFISSLDHLDVKKAIMGLLRVPAIYAIIIAMIFTQTGWQMPESIQRAISLGSGAAVPCMLVLLGLELRRSTWPKDFKALSIPVVLRLFIAPLIAYTLSILYKLPKSSTQAGITEAGMPAAVMTTVLAIEYKLDSSLVSAIVFWTTILSPLSLTPLLYFLSR